MSEDMSLRHWLAEQKRKEEEKKRMWEVTHWMPLPEPPSDSEHCDCPQLYYDSGSSPAFWKAKLTKWMEEQDAKEET